jgi:hypothetical protein
MDDVYSITITCYLYLLFTRTKWPYDPVKATEENNISSAPFVFISSCWNLISREIFFRRRMNHESISGDCPSTGEYISEGSKA